MIIILYSKESYKNMDRNYKCNTNVINNVLKGICQNPPITNKQWYTCGICYIFGVYFVFGHYLVHVLNN